MDRKKRPHKRKISGRLAPSWDHTRRPSVLVHSVDDMIDPMAHPTQSGSFSGSQSTIAGEKEIADRTNETVVDHSWTPFVNIT
jgi:hypothetical protein